MMKRRFVKGALIIIIMFILAIPVFAHPKEGTNGHDQFMSWVLFGKKYYKNTLKQGSKEFIALEMLEDAVAICLDQFNHSYKKELDSLKDNGVSGLPKSIDEINIQTNSHHRRYTHQGWNYTYTDKDKNEKWKLRKNILLQTVNKVFNSKRKFLIINVAKGYDKQCDAFAEFLYCIHILSDYDGSGFNEVYDDVMKVALAHPQENSPDIFYRMEKILPIIFSSQTSTRTYSSLMRDLRSLANEARNFVRNTPDIKGNYALYQSYAAKLLELLSDNVPFLLKNESFFKEVFGSQLVVFSYEELENYKQRKK